MDMMENNTQERAWAAIIQAIREELKKPGVSQSTVAKRLGVDRSAVNRWLKRERGGLQKTVDELVFYMNQLGLDSSVFFGQAKGGQSAKIPLIGLAACGYEYWFKEVKLPLAATSAPPGDLGARVFAVIASGDSLRPVGVTEGKIVFCDPDATPEKDDIVLIERTNGTKSLKVFRGREGADVIFEGWLPVDSAGKQEMHTLRVSESNIDRLSPAVFIRLK